MAVRRSAFLALVFAAALGTAARAAEPPVISRLLRIEIAVAADGSTDGRFRQERTPTTPSAAQQIAQATLTYNPALERIEEVEAYTLKPDGTRKPVEPAAIRDQLPPGMDGAMFYDVRQKVFVFPDLRAGDTEVLAYRRVAKPLFPGAFTFSEDFAPTVAWLDAQVTFTAPSTLPLRAEAAEGVALDRSEADGMQRLAFRYQEPDAAAQERIAVAPMDRRARLFVSSFPDYAAMAAAYQALAAPKEAVTSAVQALADEVTAGIADRREQARALYDWVSEHVRYVALYLGRGGVEPHAAGEILANGYGDCKDHVVLLAALLRAKGIPSATAMVNLGNSYTLSGPPTLAQLNHVITYLPEWDLYADSTVGTAGFGVLPFQERGKQAVLVGVDGPAVRRLPLPGPDAATAEVETRARLLPDGRIEGTTRTAATGAAAISLRLAGRAIQARSNPAIAEAQLRSLGEPGTGSFEVEHPERPEPSFAVTGRFTLDARPELLDGEAFAPPIGLELLARPGDMLLGPLANTTLPATEDTPCFAGRQVETLALELPEGRTVQRLPAARDIEGPAFTYRSRWAIEGGVLTVRRELESRVAAPLCTGELRRAVMAAQVGIRRDQRARVELAEP